MVTSITPLVSSRGLLCPNSALVRSFAAAAGSRNVFSNVSSKTSYRTAEDAVNNILYDVPASVAAEADTLHTLSVLVDNEAGVLSKVSGLLSARGFNIDSLSVSATDVPDLSRMTIVLDCPFTQLEQAKRQLEDLVDVWAVVDLSRTPCLRRELVVLKVDLLPPEQRVHQIDVQQHTEYELMEELMDNEESTKLEEDVIPAPPTDNYDASMSRHFHREAIRTLCDTFGATVADIGSEHLVVQLAASTKRVDAFIQAMRPFGVVEAARTGTIAMSRARITPLHAKIEEDDDDDDEELILPPS